METTNKLYDALYRGVNQHGRLLKLDTLLGKNALLPHRVGWDVIPASSHTRSLSAGITSQPTRLLNDNPYPWIRHSRVGGNPVARSAFWAMSIELTEKFER